MPNHRIDITGMRSGLLTAIRPTDERLHGNVLWECRCDCGNVVKYIAAKISGGHVSHCGCRRRAGSDAMNAPPHNSPGVSKYAQSGYEGVYKHGTKWISTIKRNHMQVPLGIYASAEDAYRVRCDALAHFDSDFWDWHCALMKNFETIQNENNNKGVSV